MKICFGNVCSSSLLTFVYREGCASQKWRFLGIFDYIPVLASIYVPLPHALKVFSHAEVQLSMITVIKIVS